MNQPAPESNPQGLASRADAPGWGSGPARVDSIARMVTCVATLGMLGVLGRVAQLQLSPSQNLSAHLQPRMSAGEVPAARGDIVDRKGRFLASTRFGYRLFLDPLEFPDPPHEAIVRLAEVSGLDAAEFAPRLLARMEANRERVAALERVPEAERPVLLRLAALRTPAQWPDDPDAADAPDVPFRYLRISGILDDTIIDAVRRAKIPGVHAERRGVREYPSDGLGASIIGLVNGDHQGVLGVERTKDDALRGVSGRIEYVRDARGRPLWMGQGAYSPATRGKDIRLSIDLEIQRIALEELLRGIRESEAAGGRVIVMDPATGEVLAMADAILPPPDAKPVPWVPALPRGQRRSSSGLLFDPEPRTTRYAVIQPDTGRDLLAAMARNRCVEDVYEPGSTFKPFVWASITELGLAKPAEVFNTENGRWRTSYGRPLADVVKRGTMTWTEVLVNSSNIGMVKGGERMTFDQMRKAVLRFGFGSRTNIGLQGETAGLVTSRKDWSKYTQTSVCFGSEVAVTPIQVVRAFCGFAREGELAGTLPPARLTAPGPDDADGQVIHRVLRADVALMVRSILREVARSMEAKMAAKDNPATGHVSESGWRYTMFGKSGTAKIPLGKAPPGMAPPPGLRGYYEHQYNASFVGSGPTEAPRLVVLVVIDDPGPRLVRENRYYGSQTAGPVVRRILERALGYLGVRPSPVELAGTVDPSRPAAD